ncbi:Na(+)/H(+) exchange regulatory cofactor NHE-RF1 [Eurytemora carolleeae]|uniref:Na(+)/H(+) exchange regulatory cofactor NHE-RF1 n=1 Tax=Eurytemora carolleeae TaxID=1294199 RepID=UPI000C764BD6|nr:Na(+)/H(+) exchange regulatory cofactor NHE-RF1 [Eurytemora carolleeae]|eukprot:XP_023343691.1 Na(+)/H(+) exchange regulatory cofactor NHE-RF1-like [Eurytemora affinis]
MSHFIAFLINGRPHCSAVSGFDVLCSGQFIGKVDPNSPAEAAGLREGDKIIEVNGVNISQENHKQVVQRIKAVKEETRLLVVDTKTEIYHKEKDIIITSSLPYVKHLSSDKHFEYIDTRIQTPSVPTIEHTPSVKGRDSPVGGRDSPAEGRDSPSEGRDSPAGGRDSPDSEASLEEIPPDHRYITRDVKREDSSSSERTLSNRSSMSSIGKVSSLKGLYSPFNVILDVT